MRLVAERAAGVLEVVGALRQRVAGEVEAVLGEPVGAVLEAAGGGAQRAGASRSPAAARVGDLRAVEPGRAVDAAVADEHDVVVRR